MSWTRKAIAAPLARNSAAIYLAVSKEQLPTVRKRPLLFARADLETYKAQAAQRKASSRFQSKETVHAD